MSASFPMKLQSHQICEHFQGDRAYSMTTLTKIDSPPQLVFQYSSSVVQRRYKELLTSQQILIFFRSFLRRKEGAGFQEPL